MLHVPAGMLCIIGVLCGAWVVERYLCFFSQCRSLLTGLRNYDFDVTQVLDAPALADDFYLNLVDWSAQNLLAVGLDSCVYLWSAHTSKVGWWIVEWRTWRPGLHTSNLLPVLCYSSRHTMAEYDAAPQGVPCRWTACLLQQQTRIGRVSK